MLIFAALAKDDTVRFVSDVERGKACDCHCWACGSPLVAKQGAELNWHFAHEADQLRPECVAGASNLIRRLAAEQFCSKGIPALPPCGVSLTHDRPHLGPWTEVAHWYVKLNSVERWALDAPKHEAVAWLELAGGTSAALHIEVEIQARVEPRSCDGDGELLFWLPVPKDGELRSREEALQFLERGQMYWLRAPDPDGLALAAERRLEAWTAKAEESYRLRQLVEQQQEALRERQRQTTYERARASLPPPAQARPPDEIEDASPWSHWKKPRSSYLYFGLPDGSAWVGVQHRDGRHFLMPWPYFDGWDEALPASVGLADQELGGIELASPAAAALYFFPHGGTRRTSSVWAEIARSR